MAKKFSLGERGFNVERLVESKLGKIVAVAAPASGMILKGVLRQYARGDYAVLNPFVYRDKDGIPRVVERDAVIESPVVVSEMDCETLQEYIQRYEQLPKTGAGKERDPEK